MKAILLHHLGAPCISSLRDAHDAPSERNRIFYRNPEAIVRFEPGGAVITPPHLYAAFVHADENLSTLLRFAEIPEKGLPEDTVSLLLETSILLERPPEPKARFRESIVDVPGLPPQVLLDVTSECNCSCDACYHIEDLRGYRPPLTDMKRRIDHLARLGVCLFEVTGGEAFLREDLQDILDHIRARNLHYYVVTNGGLLHRSSEILLGALQNGLGVAVSLDGVGAVHDNIRHLRGLYDTVIAGLDALTAASIPFFIVSTLHRQHVSDLEALIEVARRYQTTVHFRPAIRTGNAAFNRLPTVNLSNVRHLLADPHVRNGFLSTKKLIPHAKYYGCGLRKRISVSADGILYPCVMDRARSLLPIESYTPATLAEALRDETDRCMANSVPCHACTCRHGTDNHACGGFCRFSRSYQEMNDPMTVPMTDQPYRETFAAYYDLLMSGKKYRVWNDLIADVVHTYHIPIQTCLDLACGTGGISELLTKQGFRVVGVDASEPMLAVARKKLPNERFVRGDVRDMNLKSEPFPFAVSFYDSLNYLLTDEDMLAAFRCVKRHLRQGGIFLFDMNTREHVTVSQRNAPRIFEGDDRFIAYQFGGTNRLWTIDIDLFVRQMDGVYAHEHERHVERAYDEHDILPLLRDAGFTHLETQNVYKTYEDGQKHLSRLYFIARA